MNFRKLFKIACVFIFLVSVQGNALAATIHGTVYEWYSFKPLENSIVEINSTPEQSFVATDAEYSFNLTPGTYRITANYLEENTVVYKTEENVTISDDGEYVHDLLLFPVYQEDLLNQGDFENVDLNFEEEEAQSQASSQNKVLIFASLAFCILLLAGYLVKKEKRNTPEKAADSPGKSQTINAPKPDKLEPDKLEPDKSEPDKLEPDKSEPDKSEPDISNLDISNSDISEPEYFTIGAKMSGYSELDEAGSIEKVSRINYEPYAHHIVEEDMSKTETPFQQDVKLSSGSKTSVNSLSEEAPDSLSSKCPENPESSLPDDLKEIMNLIRANGNRITQRELRKKSPHSESKVSLMLSDLEERGLIEKFKRGRGNIIRIPDGDALKQGESME